ncbi:MAG: V-type ATPase [Methanomicrobiales archaeon 53_19]|uniref:V-type ATP synthase subunit I n=1 Tax=Methanocalculus sp. TaxID=2004547 RepID=UPI00074AA4B8|nr:V-type ATPase 116kDa subunit family protein [Methanocalculus sp.]KUK68774.1 MAG: V-type ATPase [Methanocalculus sp. 52_23]KUL02890.1 MAG: V-type ATPase [Methanomicrobiales archaeon 53_19]HIJ06469.1 V-type ATP synthase subunit I [Methanocalculus sp.]
MLQRMVKVQVLGPKKDLESIVDTLYQVGTIHLEDASRSHEQGGIILQKVEAKEADTIAANLSKIEGIQLVLPKKPPDLTKQTEIIQILSQKGQESILERAQEVIHELEAKTRDLITRKTDLEFTIANLSRYQTVIEKILPIEGQIPALEGFEITIILIQGEFEGILELIKEKLTRITHNQCELISAPIDEDTIATVVVFNRKYSSDVHTFLYSQNVNELRLPNEYLNRPLNEILLLNEERRVAAVKEVLEVEEELRELSLTWQDEVAVLARLLKDRHEEIKVFNKFGQTDYTFVMLGWIPRKFLDSTKKTLHERYGDSVVINELPASPEMMDEAPTFYDNPAFMKPFEYLLSAISHPKYREIDPTPIFAVFFPLFFGLIVGDIAYGFIILGIALLLKKKFGERLDWIHPLMNLMIIASFPTIIFGYIFGEFFGDFGENMGWLHPLEIMGVTWHRLDALIPMLVLSIAIGVFHIILGLSLGIINQWTKMRCTKYVCECRKHICEKAGMIIVIVSILILLGAIIQIIPEILMYPGIVMLIIALALIIYGGGVIASIEVISLISNILSYARIMAIGTSSVILALVANQFGGMMEVAIVGVIVAALIHLMNILLKMFVASLHSFRLHIVEFAPKFSEGGGKLYNPFGKGDRG